MSLSAYQGAARLGALVCACASGCCLSTACASPQLRRHMRIANVEHVRNKTPDTIGKRVSKTEVIVVNGKRQVDAAYLAASENTALKLPVPIADTPFSVQVVTQALMRDRGVLNINQAIETVSNVERNPTFPNSLSIRIRGFSDATTTLRDGFREQTGTQDIQGVAAIDVLKGPASVLNGGGMSSGGVVNVHTKRPLAGDDFLHVGASGGSFGLMRGVVDGNRDLSGDGSLIARFNLAYQRDDTFRHFGDYESSYAAPTFRWRPDRHDTITLFGAYQLTNFTWGPVQTPLVRKVLALPLSMNFDNPDLAASHQNSWRLGYEWLHDFNANIHFRSGFASSINNYSFGSGRLNVLRLERDGHTLTRGVSAGPQLGKDFDLQNELYGTTHTGFVRHDWMVGSELYRTEYGAKTFAATLAALNLDNPSYDARPGRFSLRSNVATQAQSASAYVQDFMTIADRVFFLGGVRYDATATGSLNKRLGSRTDIAANRFSPRLAALYATGRGTSVYVNWTTSFLPTASTTYAGKPLAPGGSRQIEAGIKQQLFQNRVQTTFAAYRIDRTNVPTTDPGHPLFSIAAGAQRSRGVEAEITGEILPGWQAVLSYAYTIASITRDRMFPAGDRLAGVAQQAGNVWTSYEFADATRLRGLGLGMGIRVETRREATLPNSFYLPGYVRLNAAGWYTFASFGHPMRAQLTLDNLTDARIYDTNGVFSMRAEAPRSLLGSIQVDF